MNRAEEEDERAKELRLLALYVLLNVDWDTCLPASEILLVEETRVNI